MSADPYGTRALRDATLAAWAAAPARLREDANAEEDHARGYYRDRVVVELAQNAADAAARAGEPGHLLLRLTEVDGRALLLAANTGHPLDRDGVASLSSLRASAKRDVAAVGRFGVGFAAVRSVADEVAVASSGGDVHFSPASTADALAGLGPEVDAEVARRQGSLPALRLPFAGPGSLGPAVEPLLGTWTTVVALGLRDASAVTEVRAQLDAVEDPLLIALPGLASVVVEVDGAPARRLDDVAARWVVAARSGVLPASALTGLPVEDAERDVWRVTWAVPRPGSGARTPGVVHAPTPTDEPCTVPALLIASLPLDPSRRHVAAGAVTDLLVDHAGATWSDLLAACGSGAGPAPLDLVPTGLPAGTLDAALRDAVLRATQAAPVLVPVGGGPALTVDRAVALAGPPGRDPAVLAAVASWLPRLVAVGVHRAQARVLGVGEVELAEVVDTMPSLDPPRLRTFLDAFVGADRTVLEQVATLPLPLVDGRTVRGTRGLTVVDGLEPPVGRTLGSWGIRLVHPEVAHPVLDRLGVERTDPVGLLRHPTVRARVLADDPEEPADDEESVDAELSAAGLRPTAQVVLGLVTAALADGAPPTPEPWWGELLLPAADGEQVPAHGLVLPGSQAERWFDPEVLPALAPVVAERFGPAAALVGVRTGLVTELLGEGWAEPTPDDEEDLALLTGRLDGWDEYLDALDAMRSAGPLDGCGTTVVADLDAVRPDAWAEVLAALTGRTDDERTDPRGHGERGGLRRALVEGPVGGRLPSYAAWWLRNRAGLGLERAFTVDRGSRLGRVLPGPPSVVAALVDDGGADADVLAALGAVAGTEDPAQLPRLLEALPEVGTVMELGLAVDLWRALGRLARAGGTLEVDRLPARLEDGTVAVVEADRVAVATPLWARLPACAPFVVTDRGTAPLLAEALDLDLAEDVVDGVVQGTGERTEVPAQVLEVYPEAPEVWVEHDELAVDGVPVSWWVEDGRAEHAHAGDGRPGSAGPVVHAATTDGLARGLAWVLGAGELARLARLLADPGAVDAALLDRAGDPPA